MRELAQLTIGTVISYTHGGYNTGLTNEYVVLDSYVDQFGHWVNVLDKETNNIEPIKATTLISETVEVAAFNIVK